MTDANRAAFLTLPVRGAAPAASRLARLNAAASDTAASEILGEMTRLPAGAGARTLLAIWDQIAPEHSRAPASRVFLDALDPASLEVMDTSTRDEAFRVQNGGLAAASYLALRDFVESSGEFEPWRGRMRGLGLKATLEASAIEFASGLTQRSDKELVTCLRDLRSYPKELAERLGVPLGEILLRHGLREAIGRLVASSHEDALWAIRQVASAMDLSSVLVDCARLLLDGADLESRMRGLSLLRYAEVLEAFARQSLLPIVTGFAVEDPGVVTMAAGLLGDASPGD